jgi:integrase
MPKAKLTETSVAKLKAPDPSGKQEIHWDTELRGFGVLCSGVKTAKTYIVQRDIPGGVKGRRMTIGDARALPLARSRAADMLDEMRRGIDPKNKAPEKVELTLQAALDAYLAARKDLRPASIAGYRLSIERYLANWLARPLREITPEMVEERHRAIVEEVVAASKRGGATGKATANGALRALRTLWVFAAERDSSLPPNPVNRLKRQWFEEPRRTDHVPASKFPAFYAALRELPNTIARDYLLLLLFSGLRRNEAAGLKWSDIDFADRTLRIPADRTKGKRPLALPLTDFVFDLLSARAALGKDKFVFPANSASGHISEPRFALDMAATEAGLKLTVHGLRRTFLTVAEESDISHLALKSLVGHSTGGDVTAGYVQLNISRLREPAQRVCDRIKELCGI